jgi:hypothetical protein
VIIFGLVRFLLKKITKLKFVLKKLKPVQTDRFRFGSVRFFWTKTGSNQFGSVFFRFFSVWVRFDFFGFRLIKPKPNRTGRFFQNFNRFNRFFSRFGSFDFFFLFSQFNQFFSFFAYPIKLCAINRQKVWNYLLKELIKDYTFIRGLN